METEIIIKERIKEKGSYWSIKKKIITFKEILAMLNTVNSVKDDVGKRNHI